jgi:hypothetical protein
LNAQVIPIRSEPVTDKDLLDFLATGCEVYIGTGLHPPAIVHYTYPDSEHHWGVDYQDGETLPHFKVILWDDSEKKNVVRWYHDFRAALVYATSHAVWRGE